MLYAILSDPLAAAAQGNIVSERVCSEEPVAKPQMQQPPLGK